MLCLRAEASAKAAHCDPTHGVLVTGAAEQTERGFQVLRETVRRALCANPQGVSTGRPSWTLGGGDGVSLLGVLGGRRGTWEMSGPSAQFCCEPKRL